MSDLKLFNECKVAKLVSRNSGEILRSLLLFNDVANRQIMGIMDHNYMWFVIKIQLNINVVNRNVFRMYLISLQIFHDTDAIFL